MANTTSKNFLEKLKQKWGLNNLLQVILILIVFALTGTTIVLIKPYIFTLLGIQRGEATILQNILYLIFVLPLYQTLLLIYGFLFGQFKFFWEKEKQIFRRIMGKKSR
jgi:CBS domain containing-hemolysin-like protein